MKYTVKHLAGNVNVSPTSPLKELAILLGTLLGIIFGIYLVLGFAVEIIVARLPNKAERSLGILFNQFYQSIPQNSNEQQVQQILDKLTENLPEDERYFKIHVIESEQANAVALPGGHILVFSALLKKMKSENELAFVLAHELGHYANKDHLRGLGRMLVLVVMTTVFFGDDSTLAQFLANSLFNVEMKFSQRQEMKADKWALKTLNARYNHVAGATDFMTMLADEEERGRLAYFFATHPFPQDRVKNIKKLIKEQNYQIKEKKPLEPF